MVTAEILKTCALTCQEGSVVNVTEQQFFALGDAARELRDDAEITLLEKPDASEALETPEDTDGAEASETPENAETPEIPEAESESETPEKKSGRGKRKKE